MKQNVNFNPGEKPLRGIIPPLVTPLRARDELDGAGLERLVEHVLSGGVHGLFLLGTTGEGPGLSYALRRDVVERVCRQAAGRAPVLVCITDTSFVESVAMAETAAGNGAFAVVAAPPYYFPEGQPELIEYIEHLTARLPLPLFLYNMPGLTKVAYEPDTVRRALEIGGVIGLKDSSGDLGYFRQIREITRGRADWSLLVGPEELLLASLRAGGQGGVAGGANVFPSLFVDLYNAAVAGDRVRAEQLQARVEQLGRIYRVGRYGSAIIKSIKCALSLMEMCDDFMAEPFHRFRDPERDQVRRILSEIN